jgi:hypothetical protein
MKFYNHKESKKKQIKQLRLSCLRSTILKIMRIKLTQDLNNINLHIELFTVLLYITVVVDETMKEMVN